MAWADGLVGSSLTPYRIKSIVPFLLMVPVDVAV